mgnify:CR=1 FL=1
MIFATPCQFAVGVKVSVEEVTEAVTAFVSETAENVVVPVKVEVRPTSATLSSSMVTSWMLAISLTGVTVNLNDVEPSEIPFMPFTYSELCSLKIVKYMAVEVLKCSFGESSVMNGNLNCPITNSSQIITAIHKTSTGISDSFKNPYNPTESAIDPSWYDYNNDANIGRTLTGQSGWNSVILATCFKLPCNNAKNRTISYVYMD